MSGKRKTITSKAEIRSLFKNGKKYFHKGLKFFLLKNTLHTQRYLYCSDKNLKTAVARNRVKRILRAHILDDECKFPVGYDVAMVAGKEFSTLKYEFRKQIIQKLLRKIDGE